MILTIVLQIQQLVLTSVQIGLGVEDKKVGSEHVKKPLLVFCDDLGGGNNIMIFV